MQRCPDQIVTNPSFAPEPTKKGPTMEVWIVTPPPKLKSGIRSNKGKKSLERESKESVHRVIVHTLRKRYLYPDFKDYL